MASITAAELDTRVCKHCGKTLREHAVEREGAWFVRPCKSEILKMDFSNGTTVADRWSIMSLEDGDNCRFCCQPLRGHVRFWHPTVGIFTDASLKVVATVSAPSPKPGGIVMMMVSSWLECRTAEQMNWKPPPPPACHEDGSPFGYRNPWAAKVAEDSRSC